MSLDLFKTFNSNLLANAFRLSSNLACSFAEPASPNAAAASIAPLTIAPIRQPSINSTASSLPLAAGGLMPPDIGVAPSSHSTEVAPISLRRSGDFNGDGWVDLPWHDPVTSEVKIWLLGETGVLGNVSLPSVVRPGWRIRGVEDFNLDHNTDLLWYNQITGETVIWLMAGTEFQRVVSLPSAGAGYRLEATGAFSTTGVDLLWRNPYTGENKVWQITGADFAIQESFLPTVPGINLSIRAVGDFNQNGSVDILWQNSLTGQSSIWWMDGLTVLATEAVPATFKVSPTSLDWAAILTAFLGASVPTVPSALPAIAPALTEPANTSAELLPAVEAALTQAGVAGNVRLDRLFEHFADQDQLLAGGVAKPLKMPQLAAAMAAMVTSPERVAAIAGLPIALSDLIAPIAPVAPIASIGLAPIPEPSPVPDGVLKDPVLEIPTSLLNWHLAAIVESETNPSFAAVFAETGTTASFRLPDPLFSQAVQLLDSFSVNWPVALQAPLVTPTAAIEIANLSFSGLEGDTGTLQIRLREAPTTPWIVTLETANFLVVDANANVQDGFQNQLIFTSDNWDQFQTIALIAEVDGSSTDRVLGNWVNFSLADGLAPVSFASVTYDLGTVVNTYAPDPTRFNIDLDFRNDYLEFWTPARQAIAQRAADDWASRIANEWEDLTLNATLNRLDTFAGRTVPFTTKRYVDDVLVFVNVSADTSGFEAALGGPDYEFGGWITSPELMPRVGQIFVNPTIYAQFPDEVLYQVVSHEIGHVLGLLGLNWQGYNLIDQTNLRTATFNGPYSTRLYGAPIPMQSQDGGDLAHPADRVESIMSYGYLYRLPAPTQLDYAMLADSGYRVRGINHFVST